MKNMSSRNPRYYPHLLPRGQHRLRHLSFPDEPIAKIAVLSFRDTASNGHNYGDALSEMITTAFIKSHYFEVIERSQIQKVMEEQQFSVSGSVDSDTAIELGAYPRCTVSGG